MLVNGIKSNDYKAVGEELNIILVCTAEEALAMDTSVIKVTTDQGDLVEQFVGYEKLSASVDAITKEVTLKCFKDDSGINKAVSGLIQSNDENVTRLDTVENAVLELAMMMG